MTHAIRILLVEDNPGDARLLRELLSEATAFAHELVHVPRLADGLVALATPGVDVVLLDLSLPDAQGLEGLRSVHAIAPAMPIIVLTGLNDDARALEALKIGAQDYLIKGQTEAPLLARSIRYALERSRAEETTRKLLGEQAARATAELERARLRSLFMQAPAAIGVVMGPEHTFELANPEYLRLMGKSDIVGKTLLDAIPELAGKGFDTLFSNVLATGQPYVGKEVAVEIDVEGEGRQQRFVDFNHEPLRNAEGRPEGVLVVAMNVTEQVLARKRVEDARLQASISEERFQLLAEVIPQMVWSMSPDGRDVYLSPRWYEFTGQLPDQPLEEKWRCAIHPEEYERCVSSWAVAAETRSSWEMEYRLRRADGEYRWHLARSVPHCDASGAILRWYGTATDIDVQRNAIRSRDDLLATVSHDLRNPLNTIKLSTEIMRATRSNGPAQRQAAIIERAALRMERLIGDLLDMASIESGHLSIDPKPCGSFDLVVEAVEAMEPIAAAKSLRLERDPAASRALVSCDRNRILQVLGNILGNATKFTPADGVIAVHAQASGAEVTFAVRDSGPGIEPSQIPHVFDRFWQAKETARAGTGLGLAICKGIIEGHRGRIWVESTVGVGTTFFFTLPVAS